MPLIDSGQIGGHLIGEKLGSGGMGLVVKAKHLQSKREVALKMLHTPQVGLLSLMREIEAIKTLDHPGIVRLLESGVEEDIVWYSMEFLDAVTLRSHMPLHAVALNDQAKTYLLSNDSITDETGLMTAAPDVYEADTMAFQECEALATQIYSEASEESMRAQEQVAIAKPKFDSETRKLLSYVAQIADALGHLHGKGMVHCDLKPENILITRDDRAVLIDFGIATIQGSKTNSTELSEAGLLLGTAMYMAPEKIRRATFDARADLYALGCIIYQMIVGYEPIFHEETGLLLGIPFQQRSTRPSDYVEGVPRELDDLVVALLSKNPKDRPGYAVKVSHVLKQIGVPNRHTPPKALPYLYRAGIFGRESQLDRLNLMRHELNTGKGSALLITGEIGIGKSCLASHVLQLSRKAEIPCFAGRAVPLNTDESAANAASLGVFAPIFRNIVDRIKLKKESPEDYFDENAKSLLPAFPFLARLNGWQADSDLQGIPKEDAEQRMLEAVISTIEKVSKNGPLTMVLDDIQWADDLSLKCINLLLNRVSRRRWILLLIARSDLPIESHIESHQDLERMALKPLPTESHRPIIEEMLGGAECPNTLLNYVSKQTKGNPLYIRMCIKSAVDDGYLKLTDTGEWAFEMRMDELISASAPRSLSDLFQVQFRALHPDERQLCNVLAVLGQASDAALLTRLTGMNLSTLLNHADALVQKGILVEADNNESAELDFLHWGCADLLTNSINADTLRDLHLQIAELIESDTEHWMDKARLARHFDHGGLHLKARELYVQAANEAVTAFAVPRAAALFEMGLALYGKDKEADQIKMQFAHKALSHRGFTERSKQLLKEAIESSATYDLDQMAAAKLMLADLLSQSRQKENVTQLIEESLAHYESKDDVIGIAKSQLQMAISQLEQDQWNEGMATLRKTQAYAKTHGIDHVYESASVNIAFAYLDTGNYREALPPCLQLLEDAEKSGDIGYWIKAMNQLSLIYLYLGDLDLALSHSKAALAKAKQYGIKRMAVSFLGNMGLIHMQREEYAECIVLSQEVLQLAQDMGLTHIEQVAVLNILLCRIELARFEEAEKTILSLSTRKEQLGPYLYGYLIYAKARLNRYRGKADSALQAIEEAMGIFQKRNFKQPHAVTLCEYGHILLCKNRWDDALSALKRADSAMKEMKVDANSELGVAVDKLKRALKAKQNGIALLIGAMEADLPIEVINRADGFKG